MRLITIFIYKKAQLLITIYNRTRRACALRVQQTLRRRIKQIESANARLSRSPIAIRDARATGANVTEHTREIVASEISWNNIGFKYILIQNCRDFTKMGASARIAVMFLMISAATAVPAGDSRPLNYGKISKVHIKNTINILIIWLSYIINLRPVIMHFCLIII